MPRVPTYDSFQATPTALPQAQVRAPEYVDAGSAQTRELGRELMAGGDALGKVALDEAQQANQLRVSDAMNQLVRARTDATVQAMQLKGRNALERPDGKSLPDEFSEKLQDSARSILETLGNDAQKQAFTLHSGQVLNQFRGVLTTHMIDQQRVFADDTDKSSISVAQDQAALLWGDKGMRDQSAAVIRQTVQGMGKRNGWDDKTVEREMQVAMSPMHVGIMNGLIKAGHASEARAYYDENSAGMTMQARAVMQGAIKEAGDAQAGESQADAVWGDLGPKTSNEPVRLFDMESKVREALKDNPDAMKKGIVALRERAQAFNSQQAETNAGNINSVYALIDSGTPMRQVMRSDGWLGLPEIKRHEIAKAIEHESMVRAQRDLYNQQREEKALLFRNSDAFLTYGDPEVLGGMSRAQVQALRPVFGLDGTQHLLSKWESLQKADGRLQANMDGDTFNQVAQEMGLDPFKTSKTKPEKEQLGALKYRIEKLIEVAQNNKKAPLSRTEKEELVRGEMARQVTVNPGWFSSNRQTPVIALSKDDAGNVVVPDTDRKQIVQALQTMYQANPADPRYAPTEQNVRRLYLMNKSKAGALINGQ